jgi:hypothetical protein
LIDLQNKRVEIYRPGQAVKVLQNLDTLLGEEILLKFTLSLKRFFRFNHYLCDLFSNLDIEIDQLLKYFS